MGRKSQLSLKSVSTTDTTLSVKSSTYIHDIQVLNLDDVLDDGRKNGDITTVRNILSNIPYRELNDPVSVTEFQLTMLKLYARYHTVLNEISRVYPFRNMSQSTKDEILHMAIELGYKAKANEMVDLGADIGTLTEEQLTRLLRNT